MEVESHPPAAQSSLASASTASAPTAPALTAPALTAPAPTAPAPTAPAPAPTPATAKKNIRYEWYQGMDFVEIGIFAKNMKRENVHVNATERSLRCCLSSPITSSFTHYFLSLSLSLSLRVYFFITVVPSALPYLSISALTIL
jgi:hypothetical protein